MYSLSFCLNKVFLKNNNTYVLFLKRICTSKYFLSMNFKIQKKIHSCISNFIIKVYLKKFWALVNNLTQINDID